ncbi:STAS domain-containing protein [Streptomyces zaomyceticus]|uniref:STAS domain-containing protein n=1 Tax=Streptomyces zaomyceticus TaxID=68286 RepID=UPI00324C8F78
MQPPSDHFIDLRTHTAGPAPRPPLTGPHPSMTAKVTPGGTVVVSGEIDSANASALRRTLRLALLAHPAGVTLDLSAVTFCDCAGLRAVLNARQQRLDGAHRALALGPVSPRVMRLLELTGTRELLGAPEPVGEDHGGAGPRRRNRVDEDGPSREEGIESMRTDRVGRTGPSQ